VDLKSADRKRLWEFKSPSGRQDSIAFSSFFLIPLLRPFPLVHAAVHVNQDTLET
jgi:hypothetical protein